LLLMTGFVMNTAPASVSAQALGLFSEGTLSGWRLSGGVGEEWDSNVRFARPHGESDLTTRARIEGARLWRTRRDVVAVAAAGALLRFNTLTDLNRSTHDVAINATRKLTRRASAGIDVRRRSELTNRSITSAGDGSLLSGLVSQRSWAASGTYAYRVSRLVTTHLGSQVTHVSFDTPGHLGGRLFGMGADVTRRQSSASSVALGYDYRHSLAADLALDAHVLSATSLHQLTPRLGTRLTTGISLAKRVSGDIQTRFLGGGALSIQGTRDLLSAEFQRSVGQEFGRESAAEFTTDLLGVTYHRVFPKGFQLDARARQAWSHRSDGSERSTRSAEAVANARYVMTTGPALLLGVFARRRDDRLAVASLGMTFGLGYGWSQVRTMPAPNQPEAR
jgi:hypothetical protein